MREMFSRIAPTYDLLNRLLSGGIDQRWRRYAVTNIGPNSPATVLDLCGGTGDMTLHVLRERPRDRVVLADFAYPMVAIARDRITARHADPRVLCGDALRLPFPDDSFDAALCAFGVRNWSDLAAGLKDVRRVLRPSGEFGILDFVKAGDGLGDKLGRLYVHHVLPTVGALVSRDGRAYRYLAESMEGFCSEPEFCDTARSAGFEVTTRKRFFLGLCWYFKLTNPR